MKYPRILRVTDLIRTTEAEVRQAAAPLPRRVSVALAELTPGVLVTLELRRTWWDRRPRGMALAALQRVLDRIRATETTVVVAAAIFSYGRVLAAQRNHPAELAGKWEFPGGKVEKGESHARALIRECAEELDIEVVIDGELARKHLDDGALLVLLEAHLIDPQAQPTALEHRELRWLAAAQLEDVEWLSANWTFLEYVSRALQMQARRP